MDYTLQIIKIMHVVIVSTYFLCLFLNLSVSVTDTSVFWKTASAFMVWCTVSILQFTEMLHMINLKKLLYKHHSYCYHNNFLTKYVRICLSHI